MTTKIGGHLRNPDHGGPGLEVTREKSGIVKRAFCDGDLEGIRNEARMLKELRGTGFAPELLEEGDDYIRQEDLGESQPVQDGEALRYNAVRLLWTLRQHRVRHGDLTGGNIIIKGDRPIAIDFQQSNFFDEPPMDKRKLSDAYYLWRSVQQPAKEHPTPDTPRVMRRWLAVMGAMGGLSLRDSMAGKTLLDLGCFQGDFCAMAAANGMFAIGIDRGGFRQGENSMEIAEELWADMVKAGPLQFYQRDIIERADFSCDAVLLFSTWAYICNEYGKEKAFDLLDRIVSQCGILFFETQLAGDGPGPDFLVTDDDVGNMLGQFGTPQPLVTIPVTDRPAERTVWKVTK